ncbi:auxin efflux carrier [Phakopsora pachyrhizi]|uniref:Auxin efflux carrier n=1 Tax=Phakopsora pachyrhizi TaxID=170000 RepID=A0AAV0AEA5_PHAPC|nr:auxin efflux carrier [Phakopsora pachyrhizi]CAH7666403.1 auxin efflux carrier [Phakopsora pachyrhizi]
MLTEQSFGKLVWVSVKPLIKITLPSLVGAYLIKSGKINNNGLKVAAKLQIYGALPCLMFANIVPSISFENFSSIGVCFGFGIFYMLVSYLMASIALKIVHVPENFKSGFVVAAVWSNWGNLPISVIQSLTSEYPFGKPMDEVLGVAYASFFVLLYNLTMYAGPGKTLIEKDYLVQLSRFGITGKRSLRRASTILTQSSLVSVEAEDFQEENDNQNIQANQEESCHSSRAIVYEQTDETQPLISPVELHTERSEIRRGFKRFWDNLLSPLSLVLLLSTFIAATPMLKALFVEVKNRESITAPDGKPVLSVILDSTQYLGAAAIPLALIVTGASFANMSIPRDSWSSLPIAAILGLSVIKLLILPVIGVAAVFAIDKTTNIFEGKEAKILKMICLYYSCTVTSTNQISLATLAASEFNTEGNVDILCAFVIVQYILYPISGTAIIATGIRILL